ncbi:MAG: hypothetical protein LBI74_11045, partial [Synergistaceae bacterium]|nr:hypothetical protein [Synergistaceae bacterium]
MSAISKGGLESASEGGRVYASQRKAGASYEEAQSAATKDAVLQLPINTLTDALSTYIGGGDVLKKALSRGLGEMTQETFQGVLSGVLDRRKPDGTPYTWGDLVNAIPEMGKMIPEVWKNEGIPAFIASAILGGIEGGFSGNIATEASAADNSIGDGMAGGLEVNSKAEFRTPTVAEFTAARDKSNRPQFMTMYTAEELSQPNFKLFLTEDNVGFALKTREDGKIDMVNVFNNSSRRGAAENILIHAIAEGAQTTDCYGGFLDKLYNSFGFNEIGRYPWDEEQRPEGWDHERYGTPDYVEFEYSEGLSRNPDDVRARIEFARSEQISRGKLVDWGDPVFLERYRETTRGGLHQETQEGDSRGLGIHSESLTDQMTDNTTKGRPEGGGQFSSQSNVNPELDGDEQASTSRDGAPRPTYTLASGKSVEEADPGEFVLKDGSPVWGQVTEELTQGRDDVPVGELRVQVGGVNERWGLLHAKEHEARAQKLGYENTEEMVDHVYQNADLLLPIGDGKNFLVIEKDGEKFHPSAVVKWNAEDKFYSLTTSFPAKDNDIRRQREKSLSSGSGPQTPAPAQAPNLNGVSTSSPEGNAVWRYGDNDSLQESVEQSPGDVNGDPANDEQALISGERRTFEPKAPETRELDKPVTIRGIREKIEKLLPWRHGKTGRKAEGIFRITPEVMRTKYRNDLPVAMHELGHFLDKRLGLSSMESESAAIATSISKELRSVGLPASGKNYTPAQVRAEGIAQFLLHYSVNDAQAREKFPTFYGFFEEKLSARPELKGQIEEIKGLVTDYFTQTPQQRLDASIVYGDEGLRAGAEEINGIKRGLENYEKYQAPDTLPGKLFAGLGTFAGQQWEPTKRGARYGLYAGSAIAIGAALAPVTGGLSLPAAGGLVTAGGVAGAVAAGNIAGHVESMFYTEAGLALDSLLEIRDKDGNPLPDDVIRTTAVLVGGANAALEFLQLRAIARHIPGMNRLIGAEAVETALKNPTVANVLKRFAGNYLKTLGFEVGTEIAQEATAIAGEETSKTIAGDGFTHATSEEVAERLGEIAGESTISFALAVLPGPAFSTYNATRAIDGAKTVTAAAEATKDLKLTGRNRELARDYIGEITAGLPIESVFLNPNAIQTLYQEGRVEDVEEALEAFGVNPEDYAEALETGADIEIPLSAFIVGANETETLDLLGPELKTEAGGMTQKEAQEINDNRDEVLEKASRDAEDLDAEYESALQVRANVRSQLFALGKSDAESSSLADMMAGAMTVAARRERVLPYEFFDRMGLTFRAGETDGQALTRYQPVNPGVNLDETVREIKVEERFKGKPVWQLRKEFPEEIRRAVLGAFGTEGIKNDDTGWHITFSSNNFDHLTNTRSRPNANIDSIHFEVIAAMPEIVRYGKLVESYDDKKNVREIEKMHRLFAPVRVGDGTYSVRIVVKEYKPGFFGIVGNDEKSITLKKLYDHTVEKTMSTGTSANAAQSLDSSGPPRPTVDKYTIRELIKDVNDADGDLYAQDRGQNTRGAIDLSDPNHVSITFTPRADVTTGVHEFGHLFLWLSDRQAAQF